MTLIRIDPVAVRQAGLGAVQTTDGLQDQAGQLRALEIPPMPPAMASKYDTGLDDVAAMLVRAGGLFGPAGIELQVRAAAAVTTDGEGGVRDTNAGTALERSIFTSVVLPGGQTANTKIKATATGEVASATVAPAGLKFTLSQAVQIPVAATDPADLKPDASKDSTKTDTSSKSGTSATDRAANERTSGQSAKHGDPVSGRPATAVANAVYGDATGASGIAGGGSGSGGGLGGAGGAGGIGGGGDASLLSGDVSNPSASPDGQHRAEDGGTPPAVPGDDATRQDWACWMAKSAAAQGLPPSLPIMSALVNSDMRPGEGMADRGFFGFDPATTKVPSGHGSAGGIQAADWWRSNPEAQLDLFMKRALRATADGDASMRDPDALGRWAAATTPDGDPAVLSGAAINAQEMVDECGALTASGGAVLPSGAGSGALSVAQSQLGVHEVGNNGGTEVNSYLASAGVGTGNPWCASFVHWSMAQSGQDLPGQGWAAVTNWVQAAQNGDFGLSLVDAADARPGDIVAYDWGGQSDFGSDGHIGFLESSVQGGQFTTVEGNAEDAVSRMQRNMNVGNVVFIRPGG